MIWRIQAKQSFTERVTSVPRSNGAIEQHKYKLIPTQSPLFFLVKTFPFFGEETAQVGDIFYPFENWFHLLIEGAEALRIILYSLGEYVAAFYQVWHKSSRLIIEDLLDLIKGLLNSLNCHFNL